MNAPATDVEVAEFVRSLERAATITSSQQGARDFYLAHAVLARMRGSENLLVEARAVLAGRDGPTLHERVALALDKIAHALGADYAHGEDVAALLGRIARMAALPPPLQSRREDRR